MFMAPTFFKLDSPEFDTEGFGSISKTLVDRKSIKKKHSRGMQDVERDDFGYPHGTSTDSEMEEAHVRKRSCFSLND